MKKHTLFRFHRVTCESVLRNKVIFKTTVERIVDRGSVKCVSDTVVRGMKLAAVWCWGNSLSDSSPIQIECEFGSVRIQQISCIKLKVM